MDSHRMNSRPAAGGAVEVVRGVKAALSQRKYAGVSLDISQAFCMIQS